MLVDDDTALYESLSQLLKMDGLAVTAAHDGESGVRKALSGAFEIVILNVMLPVLDGRKVLRRNAAPLRRLRFLRLRDANCLCVFYRL